MAKRNAPSWYQSPQAKRFFSEYWRLVLVPPLFALFFVALNAPYFWAHLRFWLDPPVIVEPIIEPTPEPEVLLEPNRVMVASLGIDTPLLYVTEKKESVYQDALMHGVAHYPGTALPGEYGMVYIFGHSSDLAWKRNPYATVFALLPRIETGAEIVVTDPQGKPFTYVVYDTKVVGPRDTSVLSQEDKSEQRLTLQTSYPVGTALQRFLVLAKLKQ